MADLLRTNNGIPIQIITESNSLEDICSNMLKISAGAIMSAIYDDKKDEDGFLYVTYSGENTFG